jgi:hypothetical protein
MWKFAKTSFTETPSSVTPETTTSAISPTISAYSTAVAPSSARSAEPTARARAVKRRICHPRSSERSGADRLTVRTDLRPRDTTGIQRRTSAGRRKRTGLSAYERCLVLLPPSRGNGPPTGTSARPVRSQGRQRAAIARQVRITGSRGATWPGAPGSCSLRRSYGRPAHTPRAERVPVSPNSYRTPDDSLASDRISGGASGVASRSERAGQRNP